MSNIHITFLGGGTMEDATIAVPELRDHYPKFICSAPCQLTTCMFAIDPDWYCKRWDILHFIEYFDLPVRSLALEKGNPMNEILERLLLEEQQLQFSSFNEQTAWQVGSWLVEYAIQNKFPITIDIRRGEQQLFHASRPGTSADNDEWIKRKVRLVNRFGHSSFYLGQLLKSEGKSIEEKFLLPESEYAPHGGCFPIMLKGTGMIGTITVSGLAQADDHKVVVAAISHYLEGK